MARNDRKTSSTMMAPHPGTGELLPVEELARAKGMKSYEAAGLCRAMGWAAGKQVTADEFDQAVTVFRNRPMGSGRI